MVADHQRRHRRPVSFLVVRNLHDPAHHSILRIERNQVRIGRQKKQISVVHPYAAMPNVQPLIWRIGVMPDLVAGARVHRPNMIRHGEVQDAIHYQRRRLDGRRLVRLPRLPADEMIAESV